MKPSIALGGAAKKRTFSLSRAFRALIVQEDGGPLVEMAVVLPLMMLIITGMTGLGIVLNQYLVLTNATQVGAMQVAISAGESGFDPCNVAATAVAAASPTLVASNITYTFQFSGVTGSVGPFKGTSASTCTTDAASVTAQTTVTVETQYPASLLIFGFKPSTINMQSWTAELVQ